MLTPSRSLINQLRVAYFVPTLDRITASSTFETSSAALCSTNPKSLYYTPKYCTPVVPFVGSIPSVVTDSNQVQTPSVALLSSPYLITNEDLPDAYCVPARHVVSSAGSTSISYKLALLDYSNVFRIGYRNTFHQYLNIYSGFPLLQKGQPLNIFF